MWNGKEHKPEMSDLGYEKERLIKINRQLTKKNDEENQRWHYDDENCDMLMDATWNARSTYVIEAKKNLANEFQDYVQMRTI